MLKLILLILSFFGTEKLLASDHVDVNEFNQMKNLMIHEGYIPYEVIPDEENEDCPLTMVFDESEGNLLIEPLLFSRSLVIVLRQENISNDISNVVAVVDQDDFVIELSCEEILIKKYTDKYRILARKGQTIKVYDIPWSKAAQANFCNN